MGWKLSAIMVKNAPAGSLEATVGRIAGCPVAATGTTTMEEAIYPGELSAVVYNDCLLIFGAQLPWSCITGARGLQYRLLQSFPRHRILVAYVHSVSNDYHYLVYENGELIRVRRGNSDGVIADEGSPLPPELPLYEGSFERDGEVMFLEQIAGETYEATHDQVGELFVSALTEEYLGFPMLQADEAFFDVPVTMLEMRPAGAFRLELESDLPWIDPAPADVEAALGWLTPRGPSFAILEGAGNDYVQAGGGADRLTVEWREYEGASFRHFVAGRSGATGSERQHVPMSEGGVEVLPGEVLDVEDARALFAAFQAGQPRPSEYHWRDDTVRFLEA